MTRRRSRISRSVLPPGGHLVLLVPAMKALYGTLDENLHHFRRYSSDELRSAVTAAGFEIDTIALSQSAGGVRLVAQLAGPEAARHAEGAAEGVQVGDAAAEARREDSEPSFGLSLLVLARRP